MLETIIYIALLAVVLGILITFLINVLRRESKISTALEVDQNARFALDRIASTVRNAKTATTPDVGLSGSTLVMTMADPLLSPTVFAVIGGALTMKQGIGPVVPLTSAGTVVTGLNFMNLLDPIANVRTEPMVVICQSNPNKRLICHSGNTQCVNKNAKLAEGDGLGPCFLTTSAKSTIRIEMTVSAPAVSVPGNEFQSTITLHDTITVPRQN